MDRELIRDLTRWERGELPLDELRAAHGARAGALVELHGRLAALGAGPVPSADAAWVGLAPMLPATGTRAGVPAIGEDGDASQGAAREGDRDGDGGTGGPAGDDEGDGLEDEDADADEPAGEEEPDEGAGDEEAGEEDRDGPTPGEEPDGSGGDGSGGGEDPDGGREEDGGSDG